LLAILLALLSGLDVQPLLCYDFQCEAADARDYFDSSAFCERGSPASGDLPCGERPDRENMWRLLREHEVLR
jgi:hypothetical protein